MKLNKVASAVMASAMAITMVTGCGSSANTTNTSSNANEKESVSTNDAAAATDDSTSSDSANKEIRSYTAFFAVPGDEINDDNVIQQKIAEITGAKVKETWLTGQTAAEAIGTLIAGGEYPDLIDGSDGTGLLYNAGALIPLDDYLPKYPNLQNFWSEEEWDKCRQDDGHIYWIPQFGNPYEKDMVPTPGEAFWIQTRVLKWAGYPEIKTLDQYFDVIEKYNAANPTMEDGTANIPYTILCDDWRYFCLENPPQFLAGYPNDGSVLVNTDTKKVEDYNTTDVAKGYFKKLNEEFAKGMIDPESFTQSYDEYIAKLSTGRVLGMVDQWWQFQNARDSIKQQGLEAQGCNYVPLSLVMDESITPNYNTESAINPANGVGISVSCKDPEGVLQFLNDLLSPEVRVLRGWGIEGVDYTVGDGGVYERNDQNWVNAADSAYKASHICTYSYLPNYTGLLTDGINASDPQQQPSEFVKSLPKDVQEALAAYGANTYLEMVDDADAAPGPWFPMYSFSNTMTTATTGGTSWLKMREVKQASLPKVIMSGDFEQGWAEYMDAYNAVNPQAFLDEMQVELDKRIENAKKYQ